MPAVPQIVERLKTYPNGRFSAVDIFVILFILYYLYVTYTDIKLFILKNSYAKIDMLINVNFQ